VAAEGDTNPLTARARLAISKRTTPVSPIGAKVATGEIGLWFFKNSLVSSQSEPRCGLVVEAKPVVLRIAQMIARSYSCARPSEGAGLNDPGPPTPSFAPFVNCFVTDAIAFYHHTGGLGETGNFRLHCKHDPGLEMYMRHHETSSARL